MDPSYYSNDGVYPQDGSAGGYGGGYGMGNGGGYGYPQGGGYPGPQDYYGGGMGGQAYEEAQMAMQVEEVRAEIAQVQGAGMKHAERVLKYGESVTEWI